MLPKLTFVVEKKLYFMVHGTREFLIVIKFFVNKLIIENS